MGTFTVTVVSPDTTPPVLYGIPTSPVTLEPDSPTGANYFYFVSASDNWDGWEPVTCTPPPVFFPIGTTTVQCSATDSWGNTATGRFSVTVLQPIVVTLAITGGTVNPVTGVATINGTVECTRGGAPTTASVYVYGTLTQRVGRTLIVASFGPFATGGPPIDCSSPAAP
jgi:HYR domain